MKLTGNRIIDKDVLEIISENLDMNYFARKAILITGAGGMLPSYFVYSFLGLNDTILKDKPLKVFALVRNKEKALKKFSRFMNRKDFNLIVKDISDFCHFEEKLDVIIHAASQASPKYYGIDPVGTLKANTLGTMNLLELARRGGTRKFLFISSGDVYGLIDGKIVSESFTGNIDCTSIRSCYGESKRMGENMCVCYAHQYGFETYSVRLAHTYGPGVDLNDGRVFADFVRNIVYGENIKINSDGSTRRCFMYVTDMIKACFYVLLKGKSGESYNISSMKEISIRELAELLCSLYPSKNIKPVFTKTKNDISYIRSKSSSLVLDNTKLWGLGWSQTVCIENGFKRMIDSFFEAING